MTKLLHKGSLDWKGNSHEIEVYESDEINGLDPITQCQGVCFVDQDHIVLFKHIGGYYSLPGGTVENGEKYEDTLKREVMEESSCKVIECGLIGYIKDVEIPSGKTKYQLRYWATVTLLDIPVQDPSRKALERLVVPINEANKLLNWGERGQVLIELAKRKYSSNSGVQSQA